MRDFSNVLYIFGIRDYCHFACKGYCNLSFLLKSFLYFFDFIPKLTVCFHVVTHIISILVFIENYSCACGITRRDLVYRPHELR